MTTIEKLIPDHVTLSADALASTPVDYDWSEGYTEEWEYVEAVYCETCEKAVLCHGYTECEDCGSELPAEGPMMMYYYPLPEALSDEQIEALVDEPLCYVRVGDTHGLALTGGGMDLSWEICEAFIKIGYFPPVHFCNLPRMAGRGESERDKEIINTCFNGVATYLSREKNRLEGTLTSLQGMLVP